MSDQPHVIVIVSHDTGRWVSPYGHPTLDTPTFERLAGESVMLERAFCAAPQCCPARAALFTGRTPHGSGMTGMLHAGFDLTATHASEYFCDAGYHTALLGFQHEARRDRRLGFEQVNIDVDLSQDAFFAAAETMLSGRPDGRPLYLQIGFGTTHRAWSQPHLTPADPDTVEVPPYLVDGPETRADLADYYGMVADYDRRLGRLLELFEKHGYVENTILVVTTDHGIAMPYAKGSLYDPGLEVLLFMRHPAGGWAHGACVDELVSHIDVLPTLLEACGIAVPGNLDGRSFLPRLRGEASEPREAVFGEKTYHDCYDPMRCIRTPRHKYIRYFDAHTLHRVPGDCWHGAFRELGAANLRRWQRSGLPLVEELFDLKADPHERHNLVDDLPHAATRDELRGRLFDWMRQTDDPLLRGPVASPFYQRAIDPAT